MKDVVTIAPLAGDPGLIGTSARTVDISRVYWSRRTGVKAAELLRPASQNSRSSRNSFRSGALIPCAGSEQTRTAPSPPPEKAQSACSAVRAAHRLLRDDGSLSTSASSGFASVHQSAPVARPSGKQPFDTVQHHLGLVRAS